MSLIYWLVSIPIKNESVGGRICLICINSKQLLTNFLFTRNIFKLVNQILINQFKAFIMKKLAIVLTVAFTLGIAASTVSASIITDDKPKKECTSTQKKSCCSEKKSCCSAKKSCCSNKKSGATEKKAETSDKK
jgi:hypothetical protein